MPKLFGTNGVRGIVNKDMNIDLAIRLGKSIGTWLNSGTVAIGTDTRLSNQMLKNAVSSALTATGVDVIDLGEVPTPAIQLYTRENSDLGIAITASHNPPQFNGIKCIDSDGTELIRDKEKDIENIYFSEEFELARWSNVGKITSDNPIQKYIDEVKLKIDMKAIKEAKLKVIVDCANGAGCYTTPYLLRELGCDVVTLNAQPDGRFPGHESEPTKENLKDLIDVVKKSGADIGIANDGDADRTIFIDEKGRFLHGDKTLTLTAKKLVEDNDGGIVITPVSSSTSVEDVVKNSGGDLIYTAVGSPIVAREMIERGAIFGGEENGGLIFADHQFCRDAGMAAAKIIELVATEGALSDLVDELPGYALDKRGVRCPNSLKDKMMSKLKQKFRSEDIDDIDGLKIYYEDGWVLIRPSGTEPKYRIYSESKDEEVAERLGIKHQDIVKNILKDIK